MCRVNSGRRRLCLSTTSSPFQLLINSVVLLFLLSPIPLSFLSSSLSTLCVVFLCLSCPIRFSNSPSSPSYLYAPERLSGVMYYFIFIFHFLQKFVATIYFVLISINFVCIYCYLKRGYLGGTMYILFTIIAVQCKCIIFALLLERN